MKIHTEKSREGSYAVAGKKIEDEIRGQDLKRWWVAEVAGVHRSTLRRWMSGEITNIRRSHLERLAAVLNAPPETLILQENDKTNTL